MFAGCRYRLEFEEAPTHMSSMTGPLQIVCPHCGAINRLPAARLGEQPKCGQCHEPLFTATPLELAAAAFERQLTRSEIPLVVDFWAPWCGPGRMMAPYYAEAARELEPQVRLAKLNTEAEPAVAARFDIRSIPTLVLFSGGREVARQAGAMGKADIVRWARSHLPG